MGVWGMEGCKPPAVLFCRKSGVWSWDSLCGSALSLSCLPIVWERRWGNVHTPRCRGLLLLLLLWLFSIAYLGLRIFDLGEFIQIRRFQWYVLNKKAENTQSMYKKLSKEKIAFDPSTQAKARAHFRRCLTNLLSCLVFREQGQKTLVIGD